MHSPFVDYIYPNEGFSLITMPYTSGSGNFQVNTSTSKIKVFRRKSDSHAPNSLAYIKYQNSIGAWSDGWIWETDIRNKTVSIANYKVKLYQSVAFRLPVVKSRKSLKRYDDTGTRLTGTIPAGYDIVFDAYGTCGNSKPYMLRAKYFRRSGTGGSWIKVNPYSSSGWGWVDTECRRGGYRSGWGLKHRRN